jgi:sugar/nucleoside kinase (ribokinase family)
MTRLLHLGNVVVDLVLNVPLLPERGADVLATASQASPGGGFNVLAAAARQGLPAAYAGAHGRGPFADLARAAMAAEGIEVLLPPRPGPDTGVVVAIVDGPGERTFVTAPGAEATLAAADLAAVRPAPGDAVYLSGYSFLHPANRAALLEWLGRLGDASPPGSGRAGPPGLERRGPTGPARVGSTGAGGAERPGPGDADAPGLRAAGVPAHAGTTIFFDPGPLADQIPAAALRAVLGHTDWLTCNAREAGLLAGQPEPLAAARVLAARHRGVIVRTGPDGCFLSNGGSEPVPIGGYAVTAVDANGAGDTHAGVFIAALASGAAPAEAARRANAAAALSVTRPGPATAPTASELARFLGGPGP